MREGFPKEVGGWGVSAEIPATRTSGVSVKEYDVIMVPQGVRNPNYGDVAVLPPDVEFPEAGFYIGVTDDAEELYNTFDSWGHEHTLISACLIDDIDYDNSDITSRYFECVMLLGFFEKVPSESYAITIRLPGDFHFKYNGRILFYIPPAVNSETGESDLKSTTIIINNNWDFTTQPVE